MRSFTWFYMLILALVNAILAAIFASQHSWGWMTFSLFWSAYSVYYRNFFQESHPS